jgi:hypothetical protein
MSSPKKIQKAKKPKRQSVRPSGFGVYIKGHPQVQKALTTLRSSATLVEEKKGKPRMVFDPDVLAMARSVLRATGEFHIRIWTSGSLAIATNVVAAAILMSPISATEWSSVAALFEEYRVDHLRVHFAPTVVAGNTGMNWAAGGYALGNDYDTATAPSGVGVVLNHAESDFFPLSSCFVVGSTSTNATSQLANKVVWHARPPRLVELSTAGTVAQAEWIETAVNWPGSINFYGVCNGTNGDTPMFYYVEHFCRVRLRR